MFLAALMSLSMCFSPQFGQSQNLTSRGSLSIWYIVLLLLLEALSEENESDKIVTDNPLRCIVRSHLQPTSLRMEIFRSHG